MKKFQAFVDAKIVPFMGVLGENKALKAITHGMMSTMPLSLGTSIIAIILNFPITAWTTFLAEAGIAVHMSAIINATTSILAVYIVFIIAYNNAKLRNVDTMTPAVLSLAAFLILMPNTIVAADGSVVSGLSFAYLGSKGIFVAILCGLLVSGLYVTLKKRNLEIKLPAGVPEMVSQSLSPTFISMIIFVVILAVRYFIGLTPDGNAFDLINNFIGQPIMKFGATPVALITLYALANLLWCFGLHPSAITSFYTPVMLTVMTSNVAAFQNGEALPYLAMMVMYQFIMLGGTGCTLGLAINMCLFGKSQHFKTLGKLAIVPNIFNINEPIIFGAPIVYNPVFMLPMTLVAIVNGITVFMLTNIGWFNTYNPTIRVPWTMPAPVIHFLQSGWLPALVAVGVIILDAFIYLPFFKFADKQALLAEKEA